MLPHPVSSAGLQAGPKSQQKSAWSSTASKRGLQVKHRLEPQWLRFRFRRYGKDDDEDSGDDDGERAMMNDE